ncbi:hypothetical protein BH24ACT1_BH24ACT1_01330 [soil metagenome]
MVDQPLAGRRIGITADRRWAEQADLFRRRGAEVLHGPTMATVDLSGEEALRQATVALIQDPPEHLVVTTGMGLRLWLEAAEGWGMERELREALAPTAITARGAKSASAVRRAGLDVAWRAPGENMEEVVAHLVKVAGDARPRVAVQLFDPGDHTSTQALRALAGELVEVPVYRWRLPDDLDPARRLVNAAISGELDVVTFTSQPAVRQLVGIAAGDGVDGALVAALNDGIFAACVGPVCAEAAREVGIRNPLWPDPPRLPAMVRQITEHLSQGNSRET